jgi:hypothetical protein
MERRVVKNVKGLKGYNVEVLDAVRNRGGLIVIVLSDLR